MKTFKECCFNVGLEPTKRQFRKFKTKRGLAYKVSIAFKCDLTNNMSQVERFTTAKRISNDKNS